MNGNLGVSPEKLVETVGVLRDQKALMQSKLTNISSSVTNLRSSWESPASEQLQGIAGTMQERFNELEKAVESFAVFLDGVIQNYDVTETQAQDILSNVLNAFKG